MWIPVIRSWRLNERHYGALQVCLTNHLPPMRVNLAVRNAPVEKSRPLRDLYDLRYFCGECVYEIQDVRAM